MTLEQEQLDALDATRSNAIVEPAAVGQTTAGPDAAAPAATVVKTKQPAGPARGFRQRAIGVSVIAGGFLTLAGFLATNWEGSDAGTLGYLDSLTENPTQSLLAATLLHFGYMGFLPMFLAFAVMTRARWKVVGTIGVIAGFFAATGLPGALLSDFYDLAIRQTLGAEQAVATSEAAQASPLAMLLMTPSFYGLIVGVVLAGFAAWRARFMPWWPVVLMIAGFFLGAAPTLLGGAIAGGSMMILMVVVGVQVLRMTGQEWATGLRRRS
ncbi:MAG: hypothetical protein ABWZ98_14620 [Nakamurella sp.]